VTVLDINAAAGLFKGRDRLDIKTIPDVMGVGLLWALEQKLTITYLLFE
jgi:hypothetical protein